MRGGQRRGPGRPLRSAPLSGGRRAEPRAAAGAARLSAPCRAARSRNAPPPAAHWGARAPCPGAGRPRPRGRRGRRQQRRRGERSGTSSGRRSRRSVGRGPGPRGAGGMCVRGKDKECGLEKRVTAPEGIAQNRKVYANEQDLH
ncbi:protein-lysine 6-oxidase-like isoform X2 [Pithys albifrons albifrons]|uniref:protein-lysine 6-oxidase-like isoform X2 n=1 Tax=Pithys albifrons albifrons TaxID=3385563 RepID=UPI003A5D02DB